MTDISNLQSLLNWKLLSGSHDFPGPDGGTCISEAATVVAGLEYRAIKSADDCPPCFSPPIAAYAIRINDRMPDDLRQELLLPFVLRLAGTADTPVIERARADIILVRTVRDMLPPLLCRQKLHDLASLCEQAKTHAQAHAAALKAYDASDGAASVVARTVLLAFEAAITATTTDAAATAASYADAAINVADVYTRREMWTKATAILDAALSIGKQAEPLATALVIARADAAKRGLATAD